MKKRKKKSVLSGQKINSPSSLILVHSSLFRQAKATDTSPSRLTHSLRSSRGGIDKLNLCPALPLRGEGVDVVFEFVFAFNVVGGRRGEEGGE
jgi:hypothetical protein